MGNTTIIELNHDRIDEIEKNPSEFVTQILMQLRSGIDARQLIIGGHVVAFFSRYNDNKKYLAWERWKNKWSINGTSHYKYK